MVAPVSPEPEISGVASEVRLSLSLLPESELMIRSKPLGLVGALISYFIVLSVLVLAWLVALDASVTPPASTWAIISPSLALILVETVKLVPEEAETDVTLAVTSPVKLMSDTSKPVIDSLNTTSKVTVALLVGSLWPLA